jgi:3-dehydroquinate synthase
MEFYIDNTKLDLNLIESDSLTIKSVPQEYKVRMHDVAPSALLDKIYKTGDVVLVDHKLLDLHNIQPDKYNTFPLTAHEANKTIETCLDLISYLKKNNFNKANTLHVIGGGIIQDVGSFVAAVYKRGIRWILYPSTLLSMCDSCIGGKNGINFNGIKNQLALFSSPTAVHVCINFIETLEDREIKSGLGEVLKLYALGGNSMLSQYESLVSKGTPNNKDAYKSLILNSLSIKKSVIEYDEFELNIRRSLNYGHTIGHAIETLSNYTIPHGQAVVLGMLLVNKIFNRSFTQLDRLCTELVRSDSIKNISLKGIKSLLLNDKKTIGGDAVFVVLDQPGKTNFYKKKIDTSLIERISKEINAAL